VALNAPGRIRKIDQSIGGKIVKFGVLKSGLPQLREVHFVLSLFLCFFVSLFICTKPDKGKPPKVFFTPLQEHAIAKMITLLLNYAFCHESNR